MKDMPLGSLVRLSSAAHDSYGYFDGFHPISRTKHWLGVLVEIREGMFHWEESQYIVHWAHGPKKNANNSWTAKKLYRKDLKYAKVPKLLKK